MVLVAFDGSLQMNKDKSTEGFQIICRLSNSVCWFDQSYHLQQDCACGVLEQSDSL